MYHYIKTICLCIFLKMYRRVSSTGAADFMKSNYRLIEPAPAHCGNRSYWYLDSIRTQSFMGKRKLLKEKREPDRKRAQFNVMIRTGKQRSLMLWHRSWCDIEKFSDPILDIEIFFYSFHSPPPYMEKKWVGLFCLLRGSPRPTVSLPVLYILIFNSPFSTVCLLTSVSFPCLRLLPTFQQISLFINLLSCLESKSKQPLSFSLCLGWVRTADISSKFSTGN